MWDLPGPGLKPVSPALAGGFLTTAPPGKFQDCFLNRHQELGVQWDKTTDGKDRRGVYEQPYSMAGNLRETDTFLEKSNIPKRSKGPEQAMVIKETGLQPQPSHQDKPGPDPGTESSASGSLRKRERRSEANPAWEAPAEPRDGAPEPCGWNL